MNQSALLDIHRLSEKGMASQRMTTTTSTQQKIYPIFRVVLLNTAKLSAQVVQPEAIKNVINDRIYAISVLNVRWYEWIQTWAQNEAQLNQSDSIIASCPHTAKKYRSIHLKRFRRKKNPYRLNGEHRLFFCGLSRLMPLVRCCRRRCRASFFASAPAQRAVHIISIQLVYTRAIIKTYSSLFCVVPPNNFTFSICSSKHA